VEGIDDAKVAPAVDVLMGGRPVGNNVVIVGGGLTGCEMAYALSKQGKQVTVVEMLQSVLSAPGIVGYTIQDLSALMAQNHVKMLSGTCLEKIVEKGAIVKNKDGEQLLEADTIITAVGYRSDDSLYKELQDYAGEVYSGALSATAGSVPQRGRCPKGQKSAGGASEYRQSL